MKIGITSYAFRWACLNNLSLVDFIKKSISSGVSGIQVCDNIQYSNLKSSEIKESLSLLKDNNLYIETGARGLDNDELIKQIDSSIMLGSKIIRLVVEIDRYSKELTIVQQKNKIIEDLYPIINYAKKMNIRIAIENHATLSGKDVSEIVNTLSDETVGACLDTMNSIALLETPIETTKYLAPKLLCVHLKDFRIIKKPDNFIIEGTALGEGDVDFNSIIDIVNTNYDLFYFLELYIKRKKTLKDTLFHEVNMVNRSIINSKLIKIDAEPQWKRKKY